MTTTTKPKGAHRSKEIERGIAAYHREQQIIKRIIRRHGNALSQSEFDRIFANGIVRREATPAERKRLGVRWMDSMKMRYKIWPVALEAYILGDINGGGEWSRWLNLLQLMVACGKAKQTGKLPNIIYSLP